MINPIALQAHHSLIGCAVCGSRGTRCGAKHTHDAGHALVLCTCTRAPPHPADYHEDESAGVRWGVDCAASATGTPLVPIELAPVSIRDPADPDDRAPAREWGSWQAPPRRRRNRISEARIGHGGGHKVHLTIDLTDDGRPCAIWVDVHKEGAVFRGMLSAIAALASQALQHGADVHEVTARLLGQRFEPDGAVEGHESITECLSIVDLLGRMIEAEFPRDGAK